MPPWPTRLVFRARPLSKALPICRCASTSSAPVHAPEQHDIVILGGGIVGLALASALSSKPVLRDTYNITLLDVANLDEAKSWQPISDAQFENRCSSITNQSRAFLQEIGAWQHVDTERTQGIEDMQVWDGLTDARLHIAASDLPQLRQNDAHFSALLPEPMSRMVENANLQRALLRSLQNRTNVSLLSRSKVDHISTSAAQGGWPVLTLSNGNSLRARLLVGADGINSPVRKFAAIDTHGWMYPTHGLVATLEAEPPLNGECHTAFQRFLPTGPLAFLPLPNNRGSLAWATRPELAKAFKTYSPEAQACMINAAFRLPFSSIQFLNNQMLKGVSSEQLIEDINWRSSYEVLGPEQMPPLFSDLHPPEVTYVQPGTVASFPYRYAHALKYLGDAHADTGLPSRTALVGDAAHVMHPLAGQGLNAGLGDVSILSDTLEQSVKDGADIGLIDALRAYPRQRYAANQGLMSAVDKLHKLYAREERPIVWARSTGVEVLNELPFIKRIMMAVGGSHPHKPTSPGSGVSFSSAASSAAETLYSASKTASMLASNARVMAPIIASRLSSMFRS